MDQITAGLAAATPAMVHRSRRQGRAAARVAHSRRADVDGPAAWRRHVRDAHRVRESRQPDAGARDDAVARSRDSRCAGRLLAGISSRALFAESLTLSLVGAGLGVLVAWIGVALLRSAMPPEVPRVGTIAVNASRPGDDRRRRDPDRTGLRPRARLAVRPAAAASALIQRERATTAGAGSRWLRSVLVVAEVALAVVLLVGAGLFLASFGRVSTVDLGLDRRDVLTARIRPLVGEKRIPRRDRAQHRAAADGPRARARDSRRHAGIARGRRPAAARRLAHCGLRHPGPERFPATPTSPSIKSRRSTSRRSRFRC